jgi:zinc protease
VLFGDGYAGLPPSGTKTSLGAITYNDVKKRVKELTVPEGAHLVIAGMVDSEEASALTSQFFGDWKGKRLKQEPTVSDPAQGKKAYVVDFEGAAQSSLALAMRAGTNSDPNYFAEEVMNQKLGESFTGRINMNLREDKGYTYGAFSQFRRYDRAGYYALASDVKSENTGDSIREVFSELTALCSTRPLTQLERDESVEGLLLGYPMTFDQVSSLGYRLVSLPIHERPVDFWSNWPEEVKKITTARANEAARPYCNTEHYQVVIAGDQKTLEPQLKTLGLEVIALDRDGLLPQGSANKEDR